MAHKATQKVSKQDAGVFLEAHLYKETKVSLVVFDPPDALDPQEFMRHVSLAVDTCKTGGSLVFVGSHKKSAEFSAACMQSKLGTDRMGDIAVMWSYPKQKGRKVVNAASRSSVITWFVKTGFRGRTFETIDLPSNVIVAEPVPYELRSNPAQKPVEVFNYILSVMSDNSGCVLDPYCGSGTSLIAAYMTGKAAFGCDNNPDQVQVSKRRLMLIEDEMSRVRPLYWWLGRGKYKSIDGGEEDVLG